MTASTAPPGRVPPPTAGLVLFGVLFAIQLVVGILPMALAIVAVPVLTLLATLALVRALGASPRETLLLRLPSAPDLLMAIPLTISLFIVSEQLSSLYQAVISVPDEFLEQARRMITIDGPVEWVVKLSAIGVGAAVSEELAFRGLIQTALSNGVRGSTAIVVAAALFTVMHFPFLTVLLPAIVLGTVAAATRSIVVTVIIHFCNNVGALLMFNVAGVEGLGDPAITPTILLPAAVLFVLSWGYYLRRLRDERAPSEPRAVPEPERVDLARAPRSIADELSRVPRHRRRLGWLVVASAVLGGIVILVGMFGWSLHRLYPERFHASCIRLLEPPVIASLEPEATDKAESVSSAFRALEVLNESGQVELADIYDLARTYLELNADGGLDPTEADVLIESIRLLVIERTTPRPL